ncbi:hypothetical protein Tsubulata_040172 [Turnera subulata]|uniref:DC1 domain-containing protein n=1 Tax=Turnera subulata TaxID=218843 RepID=A0A9Q0GGD6_9ROSI|nr:hypothetical protein Tsubulata_040172 [Turnera subulata]
MMSNKGGLKRTTTFPLKRQYPSMKIPSPIEFPTSPLLGEDIPHPSHPHPLSQVDVGDLFTCSGCKEYGSGFRFSCKKCVFQLHEFCALAPPLLPAHPFHTQHQLSLYVKPVKSGIMKSKCDVCAKPTKGYTFRCDACSFQMHPCCAMLSNEINISVHPHPLKLMPPSSSTQNNGDTGATGVTCGECKRRRSGRVFRCKICDYHLHAVCAKDMVNGLKANGVSGPEKPSVLGAAARLASQVVVEFIGGLIEGLGEGVGEIFIQSIARGRRPPTNTSRP